MNFLKKLFGARKQQPTAEQQPAPERTSVEGSEAVASEPVRELGRNLVASWKGKMFCKGDRVRIVIPAGIRKPSATGHYTGVYSRPGQTGTVVRGEKRKATSYVTPDPDEPIQVVLVKWDRQQWMERGCVQRVTLDEFEDTIHVSYLEVIEKAEASEHTLVEDSGAVASEPVRELKEPVVTVSETDEQFRFRQYKIAGVRASHLQEQADGKIYEVYRAESRATALRFLSRIPASEIPPLFYVIAKTPQGNVGRDAGGLFDETTGEDIPFPSS